MNTKIINGNGIYNNITCNGPEHPIFDPTEHQTNVSEYFLKSEYRGLLLYHKLGSGKTCTSIMIADEMLKQRKIERVYVLTPGSLRSNWIFEYCNKCGFSSEYLASNFTFITYNYGLVKNFMNDISFENSLIIVDEVHKFIRGILNVESIKKDGKFSYSAIFEIYRKIMETNNVKILCLSGTPIFQNTYEWSLLGNMLRGNKYMFKSIVPFSELGNKSKNIESIITKQNMNFAIDTKKWKKENILDTHIQGIVSYYPGDFTQYPSVKNYVVVCPMSQRQYQEYEKVRNEETIRRYTKPVRNKNKDINKYMLEMAMYIMAVKWIRTRCVSNFYYSSEIIQHPDILTTQKMLVSVNEKLEIGDNDEDKNTDVLPEYTQNEFNMLVLASEKQEDEKMPDIKLEYIKKKVEMFGWITDPKAPGYDRQTDVLNGGKLMLHSQKITTLLVNILCKFDTKHVVYTFFKKKGGIRLISTLLSRCGISNAIFSGDVSDKERNNILAKFNNINNRNGGVIKVLLITEAGEEGITLKEVNNMHILESATVFSKVSQAIGRAVRMRSHSEMPPERRYVNIYRYWSVSPTETFAVHDIDEDVIPVYRNSIDYELYQDGKNRENNEVIPFLEKLISNSIENVRVS
jgi:hypothetical protein